MSIESSHVGKLRGNANNVANHCLVVLGSAGPYGVDSRCDVEHVDVDVGGGSAARAVAGLDRDRVRG